jgi:hypothetical protein
MMNKIKIKKYTWIFLGVIFQGFIKTTDTSIEKNTSTKIQKNKKNIELIDLSNILNKKNVKKNRVYNKEKLNKDAASFVDLLKKVRTGKNIKRTKNKKIIKKNRIENNN